jgi:hypothetical protein
MMQMSNVDLLEVEDEYSVAHQIVELAPSDDKECITYYNGELMKSELYKPEENAVIHLALAKILINSIVNTDKGNDCSKPVSIEEILQHLKKAMLFFTYDAYPLVFGTLCMLIARCLKEQYGDISNTIIPLSKHSKVPVSKQKVTKQKYLREGVEWLFESSTIFSTSKDHILEFTICSVDAGLLRLLQLESEKKADECVILRTYAVTHLEEAEHQFGLVKKIDISGLPTHISLLLANRNMRHLRGLIYYLLGRANDPNGKEIGQGSGISKREVKQAFKYYCKCVEPSQLEENSIDWIEAHYRIGKLILNYSNIVLPRSNNSDNTAINHETVIFNLSIGLTDCLRKRPLKSNRTGISDSKYSENHCQAAILHFRLAARQLRFIDFDDDVNRFMLRSMVGRGELLPLARGVDVYFSLAQATIARLGLLFIVGGGFNSVSQVMDVQGGLGIQLLKEAEQSLSETIQWCNNKASKSTLTALDAHMLLYSSLKLVELKLMRSIVKGPPPLMGRGKHIYV